MKFYKETFTKNIKDLVIGLTTNYTYHGGGRKPLPEEQKKEIHNNIYFWAAGRNRAIKSEGAGRTQDGF